MLNFVVVQALRSRDTRLEGLSWAETKLGKTYFFIHLFSMLQMLVIYGKLHLGINSNNPQPQGMYILMEKLDIR